jgi:hypothetical protein
MPKKPVFYFKKMDGWDIWPTALYGVFSIGLFLCLKDNNVSELRSGIIAYSVFTHLCLYLTYYKPLRNLATYLIWVGYSLVHLGMYFYFVEAYRYKPEDIDILTLTLPVLVLFQLLRWANLKMQDVELVAPSKYGKDIWNERKPNLVDFICFLTFLMVYLAIAFRHIKSV